MGLAKKLALAHTSWGLGARTGRYLAGAAGDRLRVRVEARRAGVGMSNIVQTVLEAASNPLPEGRLDDLLRPEGDNPVMQQGFVTTSMDALWQWARTGSM